MTHDVIIVGGGIAGLTAAAYLSREGYKPLLFEKEEKCGGLINTFERNGFVFDGGIRATENSGVLFPMLKQLGIDLDFIKNEISLGIEDQIIRIEAEENINAYQNLLNSLYPDNKAEISEIIVQIKKIMEYMEVQYSIDNPAFLDVKEDRDYFIKRILPWMFKYAFTVPKINKVQLPVVNFLKRHTKNQSLLDIITQHFFTDTPAFFALSYIKIYLDYYYPLGGTGKLPQAMVNFIQRNQGEIKTGIQITSIDPVDKSVRDNNNHQYKYKQLIWCADLNSLYDLIDPDTLPESREKGTFLERQVELKDKIGNDSVFSVYLGVDLDPNYFSNISSGHFFYTPRREGESAAGPVPLDTDREVILEWLEKFYSLSTFEISIPVLRDRNLAPEGKTGLIISLLFNYHLTKRIQEQGWYEDFKSFSENKIIDVLDNSIYPGIREAVINQFSSTPLTLEKKTNNTHGAITGWSFTNHPLPAESRLPKINSSVETPLTGIYKAGQWSYSPSGLPISILTGKLAADKVAKNLRRAKKKLAD
jgi:phytoene dehydrogenase-like protein